MATSNGPDDEWRLTLANFMGMQVTGALEKLGVQTTRVDDATGERTLTALRETLQRVPTGEPATLVVYLGGHGAFTGADVQILAARGSDISLAELLKCARAEAVEEVLVFLDACNSGDGVEIARHVGAFWSSLDRHPRLVLIPSAPPRGTAYERVFSDALVTAINILTRPDKSQVNISPRQLLNVIAEVNPSLSGLRPFTDASIEDARYVALPNPPWNRGVAWAQAEESDPNWSFIDRPVLRGDIMEALTRVADEPTVLSGAAGVGKSTILRWIARTNRTPSGPGPMIYVDCRGKLLEQIQEQLRDELDLERSVLADAALFARSIAGRSVRIVLDEVEPSLRLDAFVRALAEIGEARVVVAHAEQTGVPGRGIDLADERYAVESRDAQFALARHMLARANLSEDPGFVENLVDAAGESFLMVYLLASTGADELPVQARRGTGIADALAGVFVRGVLDRLAKVGLRGVDFDGRVREVLLVLAVAEGDGVPSAQLWADVARVAALTTDPQLRDQLIEAIGPLLQTMQTTGPEGASEHSWRLQPTAVVAALRSGAQQVQADFAARLIDELRKPVTDRDPKITRYAESHLAEHLRRARRLSVLTEHPSILPDLDRASLLNSLALAHDDTSRALLAIVRLAGDADLLATLALLGGGFGLAELAERARQVVAPSVSAEWTNAPPKGHLFAADGALVVGADGTPPTADGFRSVALFGRGILSFCASGGSQAWVSAHDGVVARMTFGWSGLSAPEKIVQMPGTVHALFEREGVLTASSAGHVVCIRADEREVLTYTAVLGAVAFDLGEVAIVTATKLIRRRGGKEHSRPVPAGGRAFMSMDAAGAWVFASTDDGSLWAYRDNDLDQIVPVVGSGGASRFRALEAGGRVFTVVATASGQVQVFEMSTVPLRRWSLEFPLDVSDIVLLSPDECAISTGRGVVRVKRDESRREEEH